MGRQRQQPACAVLFDYTAGEEAVGQRGEELVTYGGDGQPAAGGAVMNLRMWLARLRGHFTDAADQARFDEEAAAHLEELAADYARRGLTPEDARAAARREFGNLTAI